MDKSNTSLCVAAIQMVSCGDYDENLKKATELLYEASSQGAELAVLPETFLTYGRKNKPDEQAQRDFLQQIGNVAHDLQLWLVAGSFPLSKTLIAENSNRLEAKHIQTKSHTQLEGTLAREKPYAASAVFNPMGECEGIYTKVHLFDVDVNDSTGRYRESDEYLHGDSIPVFETHWGRLAVAVCYDLRFPELFQYYAELGCHCICLPSAFTEATGRDHWEILVRARAIETQSYIIASNQGGTHFNDRATWGQSMIVDPWGKILAQIDKGEGVIVQEIKIDTLESIRRKMPIAQHRRI